MCMKQNFYTKTAQIIIQSRIPNIKNTSGKKKLNKWVYIAYFCIIKKKKKKKKKKTYIHAKL